MYLISKNLTNLVGDRSSTKVTNYKEKKLQVWILEQDCMDWNPHPNTFFQHQEQVEFTEPEIPHS